MPDRPRDLCFLDVETLGLDPDAPIWEFAAIRRSRDDQLHRREHFMVAHDPSGWLEDFARTAPSFAEDYQARYAEDLALSERAAALVIYSITEGAELVCCNPVFDEPRLTRLLDRHGFEPGWHYHPHDIASILQGWLAARGQLPPPPWKSDALSLAAGIDPARYDRHTALGDAQWTRDLWDRVMHDGG